jgi:hypothetical protein
MRLLSRDIGAAGVGSFFIIFDFERLDFIMAANLPSFLISQQGVPSPTFPQYLEAIS